MSDNLVNGNFETGQDLLGQYVESLLGSLRNLDLTTLECIADLIYDKSMIKGNSIYCVGNGGSAATASHIATDLFFGRRLNGEKRPKVISLAANVPLMSAIANDIGYEEVFSQQLEGMFQVGDVLFAISASGNSPNVIRAVEFARYNGGISVGLVGFDGGQLKNMCELCLHIPTPVGDYEVVEDVHHSVCHMLSAYLKYRSR